MSPFTVFALCLQLCLIQSVLSQNIGKIGSCTNSCGSYGGQGNGVVRAAGNIDACGNTCVTGSVPVVGCASFCGCAPACGSVSITGQCCGCGCQ